MAKGLVEHAGFDGGRITACAAHFDKLEASCKPLGANAVHTPAEVAEASDLVIVAVKPYMVADVLTPAREALAGKAVVSVAAGLLFDFYEDLLGAGSHQPFHHPQHAHRRGLRRDRLRAEALAQR